MLSLIRVSTTTILTLLLITSTPFVLPLGGESGRLRLRAREHFEWLSIRYDPLNQTQHYFGLTNTLNAWYEKPFHYSFGFSFGPMLGSAKDQGTAPQEVDSKIRLWNMGFEGKYFFFPQKNGFFGRAGLTGNILDTRGSLGTIPGAGYYLGLGWEFKLGKVGIAPEVAFRHVFLERRSRIFAFTPSLGIHFYQFQKKNTP